MLLSVKIHILFVVICLSPLTSGCGRVGTPAEIDNQPDRVPGRVTLYDQLGGGSAIYSITSKFIDRVMDDRQVNFTRQGHPHAWTATPDAVAQVKLYWAQYLDMLSDGPQVYEGRNLMDVHRGMDISESEWVALLEDLKVTLEQFHVPPAPADELLRRVGATHDAVVNR